MRKVLLLTILYLLILSGCQSSEVPKELLICSHLSSEYWQIAMCDLAKRKMRVLTTSHVDKRNPIWLKTDKKLMYRTANGELWVHDLGNGEEKRILEQFGQISDADWSYAADLLAFTRFSPNLADESDIWTIKLDGSDQHLVTNIQGMQYHPAISPDGEKIAYVSGKGLDAHTIWLMDIDGQNKKPLTETGRSYNLFPKWSPDGSRIAFVSETAGNLDIWLMDANGDNQEQLTTYDGLDTCPAWSGDGRRIFFVSNRTGRLQIWQVDCLNRQEKQITFGNGENNDPACIHMEKNE